MQKIIEQRVCQEHKIWFDFIGVFDIFLIVKTLVELSRILTIPHQELMPAYL